MLVAAGNRPGDMIYMRLVGNNELKSASTHLHINAQKMRLKRGGLS